MSSTRLQKQDSHIRQYLNWQDVLGAVFLECPNPRHPDKHPSVFVYPNGAYCHGCGWRTNDITYFCYVFFGWKGSETRRRIYRYLTTHPPRSAEKVAQIQPVPPEKVAQWVSQISKNDAVYIANRWGIHPRLQLKLLLGHTGIAFTIPHVGLDGQVWAVKFRRDDRKINSGNHGPKYWAYQHRPLSFLYPSYVVKRMVNSLTNRLVLCEGEFDAMAALSSGLPAIALPSGANTNLSKWAWFWHKMAELEVAIYLAFDKDNIGQQATRKARHYFQKNFPKLLVFDLDWEHDAKDVAEVVAAGGRLL